MSKYLKRFSFSRYFRVEMEFFFVIYNANVKYLWKKENIFPGRKSREMYAEHFFTDFYAEYMEYLNAAKRD